jgi:hypothetical protein
MSNVRLFSRVFAGFAALALMVGCGGSPAPVLSVAVTPTTATLVAGATQTFTATVTNDGATPGVTWTASVGSITSGGVYTAPTPVATASATITATSKSDTTKTATATVTLTPISVAITTAPVAMVAGAIQTFAATVTGDATLNQGVTWTASVGSFTGAVYTAPSPVSVASATITATSKTDTTKTATATVTLTPILVNIPTTPTTIAGAATEAITATLTGDNTANAGVAWSITSGGGSLSAVTTTSVTYTAPLPVTTANAVITATSNTDHSKTATITIPLTPISVGAISPATINLGTTTTQTFAGAAVSNDSSSSGVTWSISPATGAGTIVSTTGVYTAPATVISSATTVTVTAASVKDPTKTATATITLQPISVAAVSPATISLNGGGTQTFTGATLTYDGSNSGVTWSISPATGSIVSTTGVYTAPAVVSGTSPVTVTVTATSVKDNTKTATATVTLTPISLNAINPATASMGNSGSQAFTDSVNNDGSSSGVNWSIGSGVGTLTASSITGVTYNAPTTAISSVTTVTLTAASIKDNTKSTTATITLNPISVSIPTTPVAMIGGATQTFSATVANDGSNSGVTWSVTSGGGSFSPTTTLTGVSTTYTAANPVTGTSAVLKATSVKDPTQSASITVTLTPIGISFTTATTGITLDSGQTFALAAAVTNDSSASGASFAATGAGAGTVSPSSATGNTPGTILTATGTTISSVTVTATSNKDGTKTATTSSITVNPAITFSPASGALTAGTTNTAYSGATIAASGGTGAKTFALASGALPAPLTLSSAGVISTGTITGTAGTYSFTVRATDTATTPATVTSGTYTITVTAAPLVWGSVTGGTYTVGTAITPITLSTTGGTGAITYTVASGTLPTGLSIVGSQVVGTPTQPTVVGGNAVTFKATDSASTPVTATSASVTLIVNPVTLVVNTPTLPVGTVGAAYNTSGYQFTFTGGTGAITWTMSPTNVVGLTLSTSGLLSGTPTGVYSSTISVTATDSATNQQQHQTITPSLSVNNALTVTTTQSTLPIAYTGQAYPSTTLAAAGGSGSGYTWTVTSGLTGSNSLATLNLAVSSSGVITGTPSATGTATFTVQVTDSASHTATQQYTITAYAPLTLTIPSTSVPGPGTVSVSYTASIAALGGVPAYTYSVNGSVLATNATVSIGDGLSITNNGGTVLNITGSPTTINSGITFTVKVTDTASNSVGPNTYTIVVTNAVTITTTQSGLPYAYNGVAYTATTLAATGGLSPYTWSVTSGASSLTAINLSVSSAGVITGTPATTGAANFTVQVTDSASRTATATYIITAYTPLSLPTPNPSSLPAATTTASYTGAINAVGGVGSTYTWTVNGSNANSSAVSLGNGTMQAASSGGNALNITGTPSATGTITLNVSVKDTANTTVGPTAYTIAVSTNYSIGGQINLANSCGNGSVPTISLALKLSGTTIQTQTTDSNGNFAFTNIAAGTYTITPSITGPSSVFYPATQSVTVTTSNITNANFAVALGYTVSGTVSYSGSHTVSAANPIYLSLNGSSCGGSSNPGTSLSATGTYTIHGVEPGSYNLFAFQDNLGYGSANASNPTGNNSSVTVAAANLTGANVTLTDPSSVTLSAGPKLQGVAGFNNGALAQYQAITPSGCTNNCVEAATSYTLQWSTTSSFTAIAGSKTFPATGGGGANIWFVNKDMTTGCTNCSTLTNGSTYYFRAYGTSGGTATSPYVVFTVSGSPVPVTIGAPTGGVAVSGAITYSGTATGPMYVGFYNYSTGGGFYGQYIASPASAQAYTISVPIASTYYFISIVDNNNDGVIDAGDFSNVNGSNPPTANITGATTGKNLTLAGGNSLVSMYTGHNIQPGQSDSYQVNANVRSGVKMPVAVELISASNPDVIVPQDIAVCYDCGNHQFSLQNNTSSTVPVAGDSYGLKVTYSDGTSDASLPATVSTVLTSSAAATSLAPQTGTSTSTTPTFTWTYPASASSYTYQFWISDNNGNTIWDIPGSNSNSKGMTSSVVSIPWITSGNDVLGDNNLPTVTNLSTSINYMWNFQTIDSNYNYVQVSVHYQP